MCNVNNIICSLMGQTGILYCKIINQCLFIVTSDNFLLMLKSWNRSSDPVNFPPSACNGHWYTQLSNPAQERCLTKDQSGVCFYRYSAGRVYFVKRKLNLKDFVLELKQFFWHCRSWQATQAEMLASWRRTLRFNSTSVSSGTRWDAIAQFEFELSGSALLGF